MQGIRKISVLLMLSSCICTGPLWSQVKKAPAKKPVATKTTAPVKNIPTPIKADAAILSSKIFSVAKAAKNEILIRWAPSDEGTWTLSNKYGYGLERFTIMRDGKVLDKLERSIAKIVFKPRPLPEWDTIANKDDYAAVLAQAIYGEDFEVEMSDKKGLAQVVNQTQMLTQRYNMSMYAADHSFEAAEWAGLAYRDQKVKPNEKYFYRIFTLIPQKQRITDTALLYLSSSDIQPLPKPSEIIPEFADKSAILRWDYDSYKEYYSSYIVERSSDEGHTFQRVSDKPISKLNETEPNSPTGSMIYIDALPGNDTVYQYRIAGLTLFGETGPWSAVVKGKGRTELPLTPHITGITLADNGGYQLNWEFEDSLNPAVREFQINQAEKIEGPYSVQQSGLIAGARNTEVKNLYGSNYYTITVVPKEGETRTSLPYLLQPEDSIPPAVPIGFEASIDTNGIVLLKWLPNTEHDLAGYRIFKANVQGHEFTSATDSVWTTNEFRDTVNLKNLNHKVYYAVRAVDTRFNQSDFTKTLEVTKPDVIPPTQPVLGEYEILEAGIQLQWINSSDEDVKSHKLYRRLMADTVTTWTLLQEFTDRKTTIWLDKNLQPGQTYSYTLVAVDSARLESDPAIPLTVAVPEKRVKDAVKRVDVEVDRKNRSITINWIKVAEDRNIRLFELYRAQDKQQMSLYKQVPAATNSFIDTELQVNTRYKYAVRAVYSDGKYSDFVIKQVIY